jgi:beta-galactosidase/beta-glucuronidase
MDNMITNGGDVTYYVVRVNGQPVSGQKNSRMVAEMEIQHLPPDQQALAEVVAVTAEGKELLFG